MWRLLPSTQTREILDALASLIIPALTISRLLGVNSTQRDPKISSSAPQYSDSILKFFHVKRMSQVQPNTQLENPILTSSVRSAISHGMYFGHNGLARNTQARSHPSREQPQHLRRVAQLVLVLECSQPSDHSKVIPGNTAVAPVGSHVSVSLPV